MDSYLSKVIGVMNSNPIRTIAFDKLFER
jgi:hypothetical protein